MLELERLKAERLERIGVILKKDPTGRFYLNPRTLQLMLHVHSSSRERMLELFKSDEEVLFEFNKQDKTVVIKKYDKKREIGRVEKRYS
jgi:hypothetical protein